LLKLRRHEIKEYLDQNGFGYLDDPTNLDLTFTRNLMRHRIIPSLESQLSTSLVPILARTASVLAEEDAFLEETAERDLEDIATLTEDGMRLELSTFDRLDEARKRRALRAAVRKIKGDLRGIGYVHIDALYQLLCSGSTGSRIDIPSVLAYRDYDHLLLSKSSVMSKTSYARILKVPGVTFVQEVNLRLLSSICSPAESDVDYSQRNKAYFDLDQLTLPISVRTRRPGDRFVPFAAVGSRKLKEVFIDDKVSRRLRDSTPIVVDSKGILWIPCGRRSDRAPVTGTTERILCIEARRDSD
jgi:tRNA(Ile)-lysidine synthase